tara:strand:- start:38 stop:790 length:753 start_codon:yes stop_codon:yes gene_type:complete
MKAVAIVLASGSGQRFGEKTKPKHLTHILEVPVLVWTLNTIINSKLFSAINIVTRKNDLTQTENIVREYFSIDMFPLLFTEGSKKKRIESFLLGLGKINDINLINKETIIALFDANRPFTPSRQIKDLFETSLEFGCSCPARPVINGVARIDSGRIINIPDKSTFAEFVTPEFIKFSILEESLEKYKDSFKSLVEYALAIGIEPTPVEAYSLNAKLTYPEDKTFLDGLALDNQLLTPSKFNILKRDRKKI